jgi:hypothetical protein
MCALIDVLSRKVNKELVENSMKKANIFLEILDVVKHYIGLPDAGLVICNPVRITIFP